MPWQLLHPRHSSYESELNSAESAFLRRCKIKGQSYCSTVGPEGLSRWSGCVGTTAREISSSVLPKRQRVLCTMQKIHPASQSSGRLKLPFILTAAKGGSPLYNSSSLVTQEKCHVILFVYSVITRAASLSHARRKVLFWCKPVMNQSRKLVKKWLVQIQTHRTEKKKKKPSQETHIIPACVRGY